MVTKNDVTGDSLITKASSEAYRNNYDLIFGRGKKKSVEEQEDLANDMQEILVDNLSDLYEE